MNNELALPRASTHVFIVRWDARAPQDQTDVTKGRDASGEAVEEHSRRGAATLTLGRRPAAAWPSIASGVF